MINFLLGLILGTNISIVVLGLIKASKSFK